VPSEAAANPFPRELTTPPVTKIVFTGAEPYQVGRGWTRNNFSVTEKRTAEDAEGTERNHCLMEGGGLFAVADPREPTPAGGGV